MNKRTRQICFTGMFAAIIFVMTMLHIPVGAGGYIHVGDAVIYMAVVSMGPWGVLAAAIGAAVADAVSGFYNYIIPTVLIKILISLSFILARKKERKFLNISNIICAVVGGIITIAGYFLADLVFYRVGAVADIPANVIQAVGSVVVYIALAFAADRANLYKKVKNLIDGR